MLLLYDTATRDKTPFEPLVEGQVRIYTCGPTIWDHAHIGNFRSFLFADVLKRYLRFAGYTVYHVMNLTDVDDRIVQRVGEESVSLEEYTQRYAEAFFEDAAALNIEPADVYPRPSAHIAEMIDLIARLVERGVAYERDGSVYFSIAGFPEYGCFARLDMAGLRDGARVDTDKYDKDDARDFVLWKAWTEADGEVYWESPYGRGRPGWHLECSAMSMKYLGEVFDIHTGGIDLIFPHHQNEIAQSQGATGSPFVRRWMHNEFVNIDGIGMSKSEGNNLRLGDIGDQEQIDAFRYFSVTAHYRSTLNFTAAALAASKSALQRLRRLRTRLSAASALDSQDGLQPDATWTEIIGQARAGFCEGMDDDLNTPRAMAAVFGFVNEAEPRLADDGLCSAAAQSGADFLDEVDSALGLFGDLHKKAVESRVLTPELEELLQSREEARRSKDWGLADRLRDQLASAGIEVRDSGRRAVVDH
jgi:cysteinyl-tRNA synthetase